MTAVQTPTPEPRRVAGVMTGTSADGIDLVVARITGTAPSETIVEEARFEAPMPAAAAAAVRAAAGAADAGLDGAAWGRLEFELSMAVADLARRAHAEAPFDAIGVHGQTIWHRPPPAPSPTTVQVYDPYPLVQAMGIPVVWDFRRADLAAGGQGAPLAPVVHAPLFGASLPAGGVVLNLGGIANATVLGAAADGPAEAGGNRVLRAWDTGPGMALADALARALLNRPYDTGGETAAAGRVDEALLAAALDHPYFDLAPPKSTGREDFGDAYVARFRDRAESASLSAADQLRTACAVTAASVARELAAHGASGRELIVCGGGANHPVLLAELAHRLPGWRVRTSRELGVDPASVEGLAFALLADRRLRGAPGNLPAVSGARAPVVLGSVAGPLP